MARHFSGRRLRTLRTAANITPDGLADMVGRSAFSVREYERGRVIPSVDVLARLADTLGCATDDLFELRSVSDAA
ncbi:helix-turn-helix transcriptional regulator [Actinomadura chokoriensis]|uniref:helix-turn-helix transcriptional regulator n=1 Tax=Actinomadura chokoriensis TaxID=454156 RepID=UPI0031F81DD4